MRDTTTDCVIVHNTIVHNTVGLSGKRTRTGCKCKAVAAMVKTCFLLISSCHFYFCKLGTSLQFYCCISNVNLIYFRARHIEWCVCNVLY